MTVRFGEAILATLNALHMGDASLEKTRMPSFSRGQI